MRGLLIWMAGLVVLVLAAAGIDHHKDIDALVLAWAVSFFIWVTVGALFAARATLRFLRR